MFCLLITIRVNFGLDSIALRLSLIFCVLTCFDICDGYLCLDGFSGCTWLILAGSLCCDFAYVGFD